VDGKGIGHFATYWNAIQQANSVGGVTAVRAYFAPIFLGFANRVAPTYPSPPELPEVPVSPAPFIAAPAGVNVDVPEALAAGTWTA
jgi:hypothetical protein